MVSEYGSLPFPICHQLLSGQLDQCARLSFPCSLYWIQSSQLIFLSAKLNTCMCVCVSCSDEFDYIALSNFCLFERLQYQLLLMLDKNLSTVRGWTFAKFFLKSKKMSSVGVLIERKSKYFCEKKEKKKNLSVRRKIFKVWRKGERKKNVSVEFRVFEKKWKKSFGERIKVFWRREKKLS